jgi:RNA polymerase sigma-70 factor (ECF subfamily)
MEPGMEEDLRQLVAAGDVAAGCRLLHETFAAEVRRFVTSRRRDRPAEVDDVCQEVWTAVGRTLARFRFEASPRGWILTIARRKLVDAWRDDAPEDSLDGELADDPAIAAVIGAASSPRTKLLREERRAALRRALGALAADERELLELRYVVGMKPAEVAEVLGERANTVSQRLVRALRRLRERLLAAELFAT